MGTIKTYNARNDFLNSYFISIPYYIFLGCSRRRDVTSAAKAYEVEAGNRIGMGQGGLLTPVSPFPVTSPSLGATPDFFSLGPSAMEKEGYVQTIEDVGAPLSPFHYQLRKVCPLPVPTMRRVAKLTCRIGECPTWRKRYTNRSGHISTDGYVIDHARQPRVSLTRGQTWEDPDVDVKKLKLNSDDKVLCITSAGDVCLSYALQAKCKSIHAVGEWTGHIGRRSVC